MIPIFATAAITRDVNQATKCIPFEILFTPAHCGLVKIILKTQIKAVYFVIRMGEKQHCTLPEEELLRTARNC